ncbi:hypothetical protein V6x_54420 [Gimesia chilikensis]|uniref:Uncharacterized protein n=1 Tax=Gimesia chilikensis TaxID=2605989 RepID=A0A517WKB8_9PLAN|nr:hypothetical protein V6x_54420 [Gimesia chilikensis]
MSNIHRDCLKEGSRMGEINRLKCQALSCRKLKTVQAFRSTGF